MKWLSDKADLILGSILGALLTLAGSLFILKRQRRLELADERRIRIYAPLYDELPKVEKALTNYSPTRTDIWGEYNRIKHEHIAYLIPRDLRNKISRLFEVELKEFHEQRESLENKYREIIVDELTRGLIPITGRPDAVVIATSDPSIAALRELATYLCEADLPRASSMNLESAFKTAKARSRNLPYDDVKELFNHYLQEIRSDIEYQKLNEQRRTSLQSVKDVMKAIAKDLG